MSRSKKATLKVEALADSLDELERKMEPLFAKPLPETLGSLETMQQAKLNVVLPYLINDLIFIYLKTRGVDPKMHPVVTELERVRNYFSKLQAAEDAGKKRVSGIDKAAAGRFIKHAIFEARQNASAEKAESNNEAGPSQPLASAPVPVRVTEKMREREKYHEEHAQESDSSDEVLEIIEDSPESPLSKVVPETNEDASAATSHNGPSKRQKKRARPMDPFGPYGHEPVSKSQTSSPKKKKKRSK